MRLERSIQPISYLKSHAASLVQQLARDGEPLIVTQNGKARLVVQDIASYEAGQETLALLRLLAMGQQEAAKGKSIPVKEAFEKLRSGLKRRSRRPARA